ncbi:MAG: ABC transporter permease, partial [Rhodanobacteraceae bacterium]
MVDSVLLRPLPFPDSERLFVLSETRPGLGEMSVAYPNYLDWRRAQHSLEDLSVFRADDFNLTGDGEPERLEGAFVTASFFHVMGLPPTLGRYFAARDDRAGGANDVVLSETLWRSRFGSDQRIVGRSLVLNGIPYEVIGVMPAALAHFLQIDLCAPFGYYADRPYLTKRDSHPGLYGLARLRAGASIEQAKRNFEAIGKNLEAQFPATNAGSGIHFTPLLEQAVGEYRKTLWLLAGAAGFVLLIACANAALLLLARGATRAKEIAIRSALGASRLRVVAQLLMENLLLALIGGGLGVLFAAWGVDAIVALIPPDIPRFHEVHLDGRVLGFAAALSVGTGLLFGLLPAFKMARLDLRTAFHEGGGSRATRR